MLYTNLSTTTTWSDNYTSSSGIPGPYQSDLVVRILLYPFDTHTPGASNQPFYYDGKAPYFGCIESITFQPYGYKALVPRPNYSVLTRASSVWPAVCLGLMHIASHSLRPPRIPPILYVLSRCVCGILKSSDVVSASGHDVLASWVRKPDIWCSNIGTSSNHHCLVVFVITFGSPMKIMLRS